MRILKFSNRKKWRKTVKMTETKTDILRPEGQPEQKGMGLKSLNAIFIAVIVIISALLIGCSLHLLTAPCGLLWL